MGKNESKIIFFNNTDETVESEIGVNLMHFLYHKMMTWKEVFQGYQHIRVLTYSFGLPFLEDLMKMFIDGEVIIGSLSQVRQDAADLITTQAVVTNYICKNQYLQNRIREGTFHMYVAKDILSHEKVYLLRADDGRVRTIFTSANASARAWNGSQIENYEMSDDLECYEMYEKSYEMVKELSTDEISLDAKEIRPDGTNLDELPMFRDVKKADSALVIHDVGDDSEVEYAFIAQKMSDKMRHLLQEMHIRPNKKDGGSVFDIEKIRKMIALAGKEHDEAKEKQRLCPQLLIDYQKETIVINGKEQNLHPDIEAVTKNIRCWMKYLSGYDAFTGDTDDLKQKAWKILNHIFLSPFIAMLRYQGSRVKITGRSFPMYLLIAGPRDNGKSALIRTCQKLVLGIIPRELNQDNLSKDIIKGYDETVMGCPILIDDVNPRRWANMTDIVKTDDVLIDEKLWNHPTYLLTANKVETVTSDVAKRVIVIRTDNQLTTDSAAKFESPIKTLQGEMTNAWFRMYAGRMFPVIEQFVSEMLDDQNRPDGWQPDIYQRSSEVLISIIQEAGLDVPEELHEFTWSEYMGEAAISQQSIKALKELYHLSPEIFSVSRKSNEIIIDFTNYEGKSKILKMLYNELPVDAEKRVFGNKVAMKLDVIQEYTGLIFRPRKHFWDIFGKR
jgi:hypothetical protein